MNQLNAVFLEGNACRDAEIKATNSGGLIGKLSIATNRFYKAGDGFEKEVSFFDVDCFGEVAKLCSEKYKKGIEVRITGRLKQNRWDKDGKQHSAVIIVAERVEFGQKPKSDSVPNDDAEF